MSSTTFYNSTNLVGIGNVGIGTTNPTSTLHVVGNVFASNALSTPNVFASNILQVGSGTIGSNIALFSNIGGGSNVFVINANAYVGIGTPNPSCLLSFGQTAVNKMITLYDYSPTDPVTSATDFYGFGVNSSVLRYQAASTGYGQHVWYQGTAERMRIDANGKVGIGGVTNPLSNLHVLGGITSTYGSGQTFLQAANASGTGLTAAKVIDLQYTASKDTLSLYVPGSTNGSSSNAGITIAATSQTTAPNVGIGTTNPGCPLSFGSPALPFTKMLALWDGNNTEGTASGTSFYGFGMDSGTLRYQVPGGAGAGLHAWYQGTTQRMIIDVYGRVGIGTPSPTSNLHVVGKTYIYSTNSGTPNSSILSIGDAIGYGNPNDMNFMSGVYTGLTGTYNATIQIGKNNTALSYFLGYNGAGYFWINKYANGASDGFVVNGNNVGIGTVPSGSYPLTLYNTVGHTSTYQGYLALQNSPSGVNGSTAVLYMRNDNFGIDVSDNNGGTKKNIVFCEYGGSVGIGKIPGTALDVNGTVTATTFSGAGTNLTGTAASLTVGTATNQSGGTVSCTSATSSGNIVSKAGTLGPTIMLNWSPAYVLTSWPSYVYFVEPGNPGGFSTASFTTVGTFTNGFLAGGDNSGDGSAWNYAKLIIRVVSKGTGLNTGTITLAVSQRNADNNVVDGTTFSFTDAGEGRGYYTVISPWFNLASGNIPQIGIKFVSVTGSGATGITIGPVYIQFKN